MAVNSEKFCCCLNTQKRLSFSSFQSVQILIKELSADFASNANLFLGCGVAQMAVSRLAVKQVQVWISLSRSERWKQEDVDVGQKVWTIGCSDIAFFHKSNDPHPAECSLGPKGCEYEEKKVAGSANFLQIFCTFS